MEVGFRATLNFETFKAVKLVVMICARGLLQRVRKCYDLNIYFTSIRDLVFMLH